MIFPPFLYFFGFFAVYIIREFPLVFLKDRSKTLT